MKKRTIIIVCLSLVLAIFAVAVIATFPSYLFEEVKVYDNDIKDINSENVGESVKGEDEGTVGDSAENGIPAVLPGADGSDLSDDSVKDCYTIAKGDGVTIKAENGAMKGYKVTINKLGLLDKKYYPARHCVKGFSKNWQAFDIASVKNGKSANPDGLTKVIFSIPDEYDIDNVTVYYMLSDSSVKRLYCEINEADRTATVTFTQPGIYILVEKKKSDTADNSSSSSSNSSDNTSTESANSSSGSSSGSSSDTDSSAGSSTDSSSDGNSSTGSENSSSDTPSADPNQDSMEGWTPWY